MLILLMAGVLDMEAERRVTLVTLLPIYTTPLGVF